MQDHRHDVFEKEVQALNHAKSMVKIEGATLEDMRTEYALLVKDYEKLLDDTRVITKISDRLQNRLDRANEKLSLSRDEIARKNEMLQSTIDELTKARIGRKATTIVLGAAVLLFLISEVFLEPIVDAYANNFGISIFIKLSIALLLKPIDYLVEWYLTRDTMRKSRRRAKELQNKDKD